ncbi:hypothetical protein [Leptolyngbya sp. KIOST-1]|uniref:hypothetical protein n=1 Tax=Leptolyngbya sp. KIOST-1 TaxID=1229172 RepID=UPI0005604652|nr:hypothetical protein [Leptolyngbya sp. KIOST-1]PSR19200.1 hypothetical protein C8255_03450 [filamentous cyanobacterium CCP3]
MAIGNQAARVIAISDTVKADSKAAIATLKAQGTQPMMVAGDKVDAIRHLQRKHGKVAIMVTTLTTPRH